MTVTAVPRILNLTPVHQAITTRMMPVQAPGLSVGKILAGIFRCVHDGTSYTIHNLWLRGWRHQSCRNKFETSHRNIGRNDIDGTYSKRELLANSCRRYDSLNPAPWAPETSWGWTHHTKICVSSAWLRFVSGRRWTLGQVIFVDAWLYMERGFCLLLQLTCQSQGALFPAAYVLINSVLS